MPHQSETYRNHAVAEHEPQKETDMARTVWMPGVMAASHSTVRCGTREATQLDTSRGVMVCTACGAEQRYWFPCTFKEAQAQAIEFMNEHGNQH